MRVIYIVFILKYSTSINNKHIVNNQPIFETENIQEHSTIPLDKCTKEICDFPFGYCSTSKTCQCNVKFSNYNTNDELCSYEKRSQLIAFILEILLTFGIGHLYMYRLNYFLFK